MFRFASADPALTRVKLQPVGIGKDTAFDISERAFVYVAEAEVEAFVYCSSPFIHSQCLGSGDLHRGNMFCFRPNPNPAVAVLQCEPAHLGFVHAASAETVQAKVISTPYQQATLNLIADKEQHGTFGGWWRHLSCGCACCLFDDASGCTSRGLGYKAAPWEEYTVTRSVSSQKNQGEQWFISKMIDGLLIGSQGPLEAFAEGTGEFIRKYLRKFRGAKAAAGFVTARAQSRSWVERWLRKEHARYGATPADWAAANAKVFVRTQELQWKIPNASNGQSQTWDAYVAKVVTRT